MEFPLRSAAPSHLDDSPPCPRHRSSDQTGGESSTYRPTAEPLPRTATTLVLGMFRQGGCAPMMTLPTLRYVCREGPPLYQAKSQGEVVKMRSCEVTMQNCILASQLRNFATSQLRNFATSQLRNFATSQLRNFATSRLRDFATSRLRDFATSRLRDYATSRLRDFDGWR